MIKFGAMKCQNRPINKIVKNKSINTIENVENNKSRDMLPKNVIDFNFFVEEKLNT